MKFENVKDKIIEKLNSKDLGVQEELILIDGFINQPLARSVGEITIGGSVVPMIMTVGKKTGRIYFFAFNDLGIQDEQR